MNTICQTQGLPSLAFHGSMRLRVVRSGDRLRFPPGRPLKAIKEMHLTFE